MVNHIIIFELINLIIISIGWNNLSGINTKTNMDKMREISSFGELEGRAEKMVQHGLHHLQNTKIIL